MVSLKFSIDIILLAALWPWVNSASNRKEYQEYFLRSKGGRCVGLTILPLALANTHEIWEPQPLEPSGSVQACTGIALLFFTDILNIQY
jgi:hypothetical protein